MALQDKQERSVVGIINDPRSASIHVNVNRVLEQAYHESIQPLVHELFDEKDLQWSERGLREENLRYIREQRKVGRNDAILVDAPITARGARVAETYIHSELFVKRVLELKGYNYSVLSLEEQEFIDQRLLGAIFEDIALSYIRVRFPDSAISSALPIWQTFYPDKPLIKAPFDTGSIMGISVPDAVEIDQDNLGLYVRNVFEFTARAHNDKRHWHEKPENFPKGKKDKVAGKFIDPEAMIIFVVPVDSPLTNISDEELESQSAAVIEVPIYKAVLSRIFEAMIAEVVAYPDPQLHPDSATPQEIDAIKAYGNATNTREVRAGRAYARRLYNERNHDNLVEDEAL